MKKTLALVIWLLTISPAFGHEDIHQQCIDLVLGYAYHRDNFNAEEFSQLFTEDASLTVGGQTWVGREEIRGRIQELRNGSTIRHLMSTMRIVPDGEDRATGVSYVTIYNAPPGVTEVEGFLLIGEYHDEFVRTEEGWKIQTRELRPVYRYARD